MAKTANAIGLIVFFNPYPFLSAVFQTNKAQNPEKRKTGPQITAIKVKIIIILLGILL
jgi:hypothetical protein